MKLLPGRVGPFTVIKVNYSQYFRQMMFQKASGLWKGETQISLIQRLIPSLENSAHMWPIMWRSLGPKISCVERSTRYGDISSAVTLSSVIFPQVLCTELDISSDKYYRIISKTNHKTNLGYMMQLLKSRPYNCITVHWFWITPTQSPSTADK